MKTATHTKLFAIILSLILCCYISGCSNDKEIENNTEDINIVDKTTNTEKTMDGIFRYANWGDSGQKIEECEPTECAFKSDEGLIYTNINLSSFNTHVCYSLRDDKFCGGMYKIVDTHTNYDKYIEDYKRLDELLITKYGEPEVYKEDWSSDFLKDTPGVALYYGDVEYTTLWEMDNVNVFHTLSSDNFEFTHAILYINPHEDIQPDTQGL